MNQPTNQTLFIDSVILFKPMYCSYAPSLPPLPGKKNKQKQKKAERSLNMYSVLPYFLSKMIAELPISALFPSIFGVILYQMTGLHPKRERYVGVCVCKGDTCVGAIRNKGSDSDKR